MIKLITAKRKPVDLFGMDFKNEQIKSLNLQWQPYKDLYPKRIILGFNWCFLKPNYQKICGIRLYRFLIFSIMIYDDKELRNYEQS